MKPSKSDREVHIIRNGALFYVVDEQSRSLFDRDLGLPFDCFTLEQKECVSSLLKRAHIKVNLRNYEPLIHEQVIPLLEEWMSSSPFKQPIKKKYEFSISNPADGFLRLLHLGPPANSLELKAKAVGKCQANADTFITRIWEVIEPHFFRIKVFDAQVETRKHRSGGTVVELNYPVVFTKTDSLDLDADNEDSDDE